MDSLIERDLKHIWHPCSQMKDYETFEPIVIKKARGSYIELSNGKQVIDAISSWWCKTLGHNHPRLRKALLKQINDFEHVIFTHTTNEIIVRLSEKLTMLTSTLKRVFYAGEGASAIEIALKMSLHSRRIMGEHQKTKFIALENGYHGETVGALSVSDIGIYKESYQPMLFNVTYLDSLPYVLNKNDPLWNNCEAAWAIIKQQLDKHIETTTAIIVEPIVQGAGGMKIYSQDFLKRVRKYCFEKNVHLIADEIMTGLGRTGKMLACQHAGIEPDFICLSKGLTAGWMPFSAVLTNESIYQTFYDDYHKGKSFLHSHTYSGHALAASIAIEVLTLLEEFHLCERVLQLEQWMVNAMEEIADETRRLRNIRHIGAIVAADLIVSNTQKRYGFEIYKKAVELGALLRPLGNTIYWLPPLNTDYKTIERLKDITKRAIQSV